MQKCSRRRRDKKRKVRARVRVEVRVKVKNIWIRAYLARIMMFLSKNQIFQGLNRLSLQKISVKNQYRSRDKVHYHAKKERSKKK